MINQLLSHSVLSVSYTHLDVYKRQNHIRAENSQGPNNDPSNENKRDYSNDDIEKYGTEPECSKYLVRW